MPKQLSAEEYAALPEVLTATEVALILSSTPVQVRRWAASGQLPAVRVGRTWRFSKKRLEALVAGEVPPPA